MIDLKKGSKYDILLKLQEDPLASGRMVAKELGLSPTTAIKIIDELKEEKAFTNVHPDLNLDTLGLQIIDIIATPYSLEALKNMEKRKNSSNQILNFTHPYILFHARIYGYFDGIFFQLRIPKTIEAEKNVVLFFEKLIEEKYLKNFQMLERKPKLIFFTKANLEAWIPEEFKWKFDGEKWLTRFDSEFYSKDCYLEDIETRETNLEEFDEIDMLLLEQLTLDSRRRNKEIGDSMLQSLKEKSNFDLPVQYSTQDLSRRLKILKENAIDRFRLFLNWKTFDIYNTAIFFVKADEEKTRKIGGYIKKYSDEFPFESVFTGLEDGFYWYIRAPSSVISYISEFLLQQGLETRFSMLDYRSSNIYTFWPETFIKDKNQWRTDKYFMVDEPLELLKPYKV